MKGAKRLFIAEPARRGEGEQIAAHALGVALNPTADDDMRRFETIEKERLVAQHAAVVAVLDGKIKALEADAAVLREQIQRYGRRENHLMLGLAALGMMVAYFYLRDLGCSVPSWTRFWGF